MASVFLLLVLSSSELLDSLRSTSLGYHRAWLALDGWVHKKWVILIGKAEIPAEMGVIKHYWCIRFHLKKIILILPYKLYVFEFLNVILGRALLRVGVASLLVAQQKVVNQLLPPLNNASDNVKREHSQRMKDVHALVQKLRVALLSLCSHLLDPQASQLQVLLIGFSQDLLQLNNLWHAALPRNNGPNGVLYWWSFILQIFYFFDHYWCVLLRLEAVNAIEKHCSMIVRNDVSFPSC